MYSTVFSASHDIRFTSGSEPRCSVYIFGQELDLFSKTQAAFPNRNTSSLDPSIVMAVWYYILAPFLPLGLVSLLSLVFQCLVAYCIIDGQYGSTLTPVFRMDTCAAEREPSVGTEAHGTVGRNARGPNTHSSLAGERCVTALGRALRCGILIYTACSSARLRCSVERGGHA